MSWLIAVVVANWIEIILFVATMVVASYFLAYVLSARDMFFTRLESGNMKFIKTGDGLRKIIYNTPGFELDKDDVFVPTTEKKGRPWLGLYWIGLPPFAKIHKFNIVKEIENPEGEKPGDWILREKEEVTVDSLRFVFPRPYLLREVELKDRTSVDVLVVIKFQVVQPFIPVFFFKGKFFENAGADIRATVSDILKRYTLEEFVVAKSKGEADGVLSEMKNPEGEFNKTLIGQVGLIVTGASIPQYDPSDKDLRKAMNARTIAEERGQARVAEANAEATAQERLATAQRIEVEEMVAGFKGDTLSAAKVLRAKALAGKDSKISTLVDGGASPVVPVGGGKT